MSRINFLPIRAFAGFVFLHLSMVFSFTFDDFIPGPGFHIFVIVHL